MTERRYLAVSREQCCRLCFVYHHHPLDEMGCFVPDEHGVAATLFAGRGYFTDRLYVTEIDDAVTSLQFLRLDGLENHCCMNHRQRKPKSADLGPAWRKESWTTELTLSRFPSE